MLVLSLFPGIGLLDMAFELEGFTVVRGPDVLWGGDVHRFHPPAGKFDGVIGGPPCQSFSSLAHLVRANGHEPKFGNLIPEFERCVLEAQPAWFLMENVPAAPEPSVTGYGVTSFMLDNSMLDSGDGWGNEQRRVRRLCFGMRGVTSPPSLMRWIDLAVFVLPDAERTITQSPVNNSTEAKTRKNAVIAATSSNPGCMGTTKAAKERLRTRTVTDAGHEQNPSGCGPVRTGAVIGSDGGKSVRIGRFKLPDACRLQGLPEDFLEHAPFTAEGKLKAVANGVPLPMGRALAKAVREACRG